MLPLIQCSCHAPCLLAAGIFIAYVGMRDIPVLVPAPFPNLTKLASGLNIGSGERTLLMLDPFPCL